MIPIALRATIRFMVIIVSETSYPNENRNKLRDKRDSPQKRVSGEDRESKR